jgi:hypothetical protein
MKLLFIIKDWAGNDISLPQGDVWNTFDDAEECLSEYLGDSYDTDRQEYYIDAIGESFLD